jgi:ankyrin repeat protein
LDSPSDISDDVPVYARDYVKLPPPRGLRGLCEHIKTALSLRLDPEYASSPFFLAHGVFSESGPLAGQTDQVFQERCDEFFHLIEELVMSIPEEPVPSGDVEMVIRSVDAFGNNGLAIAARRADLASVQSILSLEMDRDQRQALLESRNAEGLTPLLYCLWDVPAGEFSLTDEEYVGLQHRISRDYSGRSAPSSRWTSAVASPHQGIHLPCVRSLDLLLPVLESLCVAGADTNATDRAGLTACMLAASGVWIPFKEKYLPQSAMFPERNRLVSFLLERGASATIDRDAHGETLLLMALRVRSPPSSRVLITSSDISFPNEDW